MAALLSCKSVQLAGSSAAVRRVLPAVGSRFMQLGPQQQAPCRQISSQAQVVQNPGQAAYAPPVYQVPQEAAGAQPMSAMVFTDFSVYKTKGAMSVKPIKPTWASTGQGGWKMDRNGAMLFELANPIAGAERRYNWDQKVVIGLQANELSTILADPATEHSFYHDTFKGQAGKQGTLVKTLKWSRAPDGNAYFINASVTDKGNNINNSVSVSLTKAEFYTFKRLVDYSIPYMLGWDALFVSTQG